MIDKPPKTNCEVASKKVAKDYIEKMRKIISGEIEPSDVIDEEKILPETPETEKDKNKLKPAKGGTWHDGYDNY